MNRDELYGMRFVVTQDRYGGAYSQGAWVAYVENDSYACYEQPWGSNDVTCGNFWHWWRTTASRGDVLVERGDTPTEALERLFAHAGIVIDEKDEVL